MPNHSFTFAFIATIVLLSSPQSSTAYELEWNQTEARIELKPGEMEARAEFVVTNKGKETIEIDHIKTSCGCTGSILDTKSVAPGESATIIGTFKSKNRHGLNHNQLQVFLKGLNEPAETLHMLVNVPKLIEVQPVIVYWNKNSPKTEREVRIKLDKRYIDTISNIEYDSELLTVTEKEDPDAHFDRILTILPKSFDQRLRHAITIKGTGENDITADVKLQVFVQP